MKAKIARVQLAYLRTRLAETLILRSYDRWWDRLAISASALADVALALEIDPEPSLNLRFCCAKLFAAAKNTHAALEQLDSILRMDPNCLPALAKRERILLEQEGPKRAAITLKLVTDLLASMQAGSPDSSAADRRQLHFLKGMCHYMNFDFRDAVAEFEASVESKGVFIDDEDFPMYWMLECRILLGERDIGLAFLRKHVSNDPESVEYYTNLKQEPDSGLEYALLGIIPEAEYAEWQRNYRREVHTPYRSRSLTVKTIFYRQRLAFWANRLFESGTGELSQLPEMPLFENWVHRKPTVAV